MKQWRGSARFSVVLLGGVHLLGCTGNVVDGRIRPEHFKFKTVTRVSPGGGGWRAVCIRARIKNGNTGSSGLCAFEVGLPILPGGAQEELSLTFSQVLAADLANTAARAVLSSLPPETMFAAACNAFKAQYDALMKAAVAGAKVSACGVRTPVVDFDPEHP